MLLARPRKVTSGDAKALLALAGDGFTVKQENSGGWTAIAAASVRGHVHVIDWLVYLSRGARPDVTKHDGSGCAVPHS
jgi:hypothetical protein